MVNAFKIGNRKIGEIFYPLVIAEIGINHDGNLKKAFQMIDDAKKAGCECVKFQIHIPEKEMIKNNVVPGNSTKNIWQIISKSTLSLEKEKKIFNYVKKKKMIYIATPFSKEAADFLIQMGVSAFKIGSGECNNYPLIDYISKFRKPIILSTGMNKISSIKKSYKIIKKNRCKVAMLHCVSLYPTPYEYLNLRRILKLKNEFKKIPIGFSDHSRGIHVATSSVLYGASIIEKHFTSSKKWNGPDIPISITPNELKNLIQHSKDMFNANNLLNENKMLEKEKATIDFAYSSVVSTSKIKKGDIFSDKNIWVKRPGLGDFLAKDLKKLFGKKAKRSIQPDKYIKKEDLY